MKERHWVSGLPKDVKTLTAQCLLDQMPSRTSSLEKRKCGRKFGPETRNVDIQKELGECGLSPRCDLADIKSAASRFKVRAATVDGVHPGMMKFCEDHVVEMGGAFLHLFDKGADGHHRRLSCRFD